MKYHIFSILLVAFSFTSCVQIAGLTSGYSHLSKQQQEKVVKYRGRISDIQDYSFVYAVTVEQVKDFVSTHEKVIVYDYTPFCTSDNCVSPEKLKEFCNGKGAELLIISNTYDDLFPSLTPQIPMLIIDTDEYGTKRRSKYIDAFYHTLLGKSQKEINFALYHYFYKGMYLESSRDLEKSRKSFFMVKKY